MSGRSNVVTISVPDSLMPVVRALRKKEELSRVCQDALKSYAKKNGIFGKVLA